MNFHVPHWASVQMQIPEATAMVGIQMEKTGVNNPVQKKTSHEVLKRQWSRLIYLVFMIKARRRNRHGPKEIEPKKYELKITARKVKISQEWQVDFLDICQ